MVEITVCGSIDIDTGMIIDCSLLDEKVLGIINELDHKRLDLDVEYFVFNQSTGENIAMFFWKRLSEEFGDELSNVKVFENDRSYFDYFEEEEQ